MPDDNKPDDAQAQAIARGDVIEDNQTDDKDGEDAAAAAAAAAADDKKPDNDEKDAGDKGDDDAAAAAAAAAADDDKDGEDKDGEDKGPMVPQSRMKEAVGKERGRADKAEAALKQYQEREKQQEEAADHEAAMAKQKELLKQHASQLADGELEKAADTMEEILQLRDDMQTAKMARQADNARNSAKIEVQYDQTVERLEKEYPEINPDSDDFDQDAVRRVQAMVTGLMQSEGKNPAEALQEATDILLKPAKDAKKESLREKPNEEAAEAGLRRKQAQIDKNLEAADKQPPKTDDVGQDHDATGGPMDIAAVRAMSFEEFAKLPDDELAKMRGDFIQ